MTPPSRRVGQPHSAVGARAMAASRRSVLPAGRLARRCRCSAPRRCSPPAVATTAAGGGGRSSVKFGMNEAKRRRAGLRPARRPWPTPTPRRPASTVEPNAVDHNTFQENINTYLQGNPDDVFTWFAGFRMDQFAEQGLISDVSDVVADRRHQRQLQGGLDRQRRQAVLRAGGLLPLGGLLPEVGLREEAATRRRRRSTSSTTLMKKMQGDDIAPFAFATRTAGRRWAPSTSSTCGSTASTST